MPKLVARTVIPPTPPGVKSRTKLGEGIIWDEEHARFLWIDIIKGKIFTHDPSGSGTSTFVDTRQAIGTVVPCTATSVVAALCSGICEVSLTDGRIRKFYGNPESELPENLWNDGKCDPRGRLWVGSKEIFCERPTGALWSLEPGGSWVKHLSGVGVSNGLVWSADEKTFWYIDSPTGQIDAFDYDAGRGKISERRPAVVIDTAVEGYPDGCTIDSDDKIWVAMWGGGAVVRYDPCTGEALCKVAVPKASQVTACAFGGPKLDQLYVTTASCGLEASKLAKGGAEENAGACFVIDCAGVACGVPAIPFGGRKDETSGQAGTSRDTSAAARGKRVAQVEGGNEKRSKR